MIHWLWLSLAIPIIVHLVHRRKAKPMPFSTLHFLRMLDQRVARRQRLRELLLLAARIAVLAALVGALERPILKSANFRGGSVPATAVIVMDNSGSMQAVSQGTSSFERARNAALQVVDGLKSEDSAALLLSDPAGEAAPAATGAVAELRTRIAKLECGYGGGDLGSPLQRAVGLFEKSPSPAKELYILTDLQRCAMPQAVKETMARIPRDIPVYLVNAGAETQANLAVTRLDTGLAVHTANAPFAISCRVENTGSASAIGALSLIVDDAKVAEQPVAIAPGGAQTVIFRHAFRDAGVHTGRVELGADGCPADDRRWFAISALEKLPVLLVDGAPSAVRHLDGAFFLRLALQGNAQDGASSPVTVEVVRPDELESRNVDSYGCIIFAGVPAVGEGWPDRLADYVRRGGGLLIFCGEGVNQYAWNAAIGPGTAESRRLMPSALGDVSMPQPGADPRFFRIQEADRDHPALRDIFSAMDLSTTQVNALLACAPPTDPASAVILKSDAGPLLMEHRFGAGRVMLCATSCNTSWNNMPLKSYFLPLVHQLVYYLSRSDGESGDVTVGAARTIKVTGDRPVELRIIPPPERPDEQPQAISLRTAVAGAENKLLFTGAARPGIYRVEYMAGERRVREAFAASPPPGECDLARLSADEAKTLLGRANLIYSDKPDQISQIIQVQRQGLPLWDYLLLAALALVVLEAFMANVFVKH